MDNLQHSHQFNRKISILIEDEKWTNLERNNIDLALKVVVSDASTNTLIPTMTVPLKVMMA